LFFLLVSRATTIDAPNNTIPRNKKRIELFFQFLTSDARTEKDQQKKSQKPKNLFVLSAVVWVGGECDVMDD